LLTKEQNELLTQTDPGKPCGEMMRRYWQPVALAEELYGADGPLPVRILGEDLVLIRDDQGRIGLLGLHCSHRGADLSYGRLEDGGLRCLYHGWLYGVEGRCLDQPGEPPGSKFCEKVRHLAYPCQERGGMIFTYMGPGEPPLLPNYDFLAAPLDNLFLVKLFQDCNFLQAHEGNLDQVHLSFLHRLGEQAMGGTTLEVTAKGSSRTAASLLVGDTAPRIESQITDFGVREMVMRNAPEGYYLKVANSVLPCFSSFAAGMNGRDGYGINWHVPIDDTCHWKYMIMFRRDGAVDSEGMRSALLGEAGLGADGRFRRNRSNRYLQDRSELKGQTFTGLGRSFALHDTWAVEGEGVIFDRTREHLGSSDKSTILIRQVMMEAIKRVQRGEDPPHVIRDPKENAFPQHIVIAEVVPGEKPWQDFLDEQIAANTRGSHDELAAATAS